MTPPARPDSQKLSLRNRFKARCFERAAKAREKAIKGKRYANQLGSDDFMDYDDDDEDEEDIMQDEVCVFFSWSIITVWMTECVYKILYLDFSKNHGQCY